MFEKIIQFSLDNKLLVILGVVALIVVGAVSATKIPLDAVPDITNNQVQIVSTSPSLAPQEVEQLITYPLEAAMTNIPGVVEVRSISRYGLSVITVVFEESIPVMKARQFVQEQLNIARPELPAGLTEPELMPITTGLGEIYQYVLTVDPAYAHLYDATELRSIQDWIVKRQLNGTKGVIEVSSFGGYLKQYEVSVDPNMLKANKLTIPDVIASLEANNENSGGSYIEKGPYSYYIRTEGRAESIEELENILVKNQHGIPVRVADVATVQLGSAKRYGAMTMDGKGEVVGGITLMFKGANSSEVLRNVKERMEVVEASLPEGVNIYPYLDRSKLIGKTIDTVKTNLIEGGLIVIFVLLLLLGNIRAGLIVASVIPLSMLFALTMMRYMGISANLMSLGAIDFGIVIDGAVIIVESLLHTLALGYMGQKLTQREMDGVVRKSTASIYRSAAFGVLIILVVFVPILTLQGTEGKTFRPMAQTVGFAILGSLILSVTYVPVMASMFLKKKISSKRNLADRLVDGIKSLYKPALRLSLRMPAMTISATILVFALSLMLFGRLGAEFVPTLEEGDIAMQQSIKPGSSLEESIRTASMAEALLLKNFPEVDHVVSKIGTAEVPTDPMAIEDADVMIILKDKREWTSASNRESLVAKMKEVLEPITWASFEFTQPIQLRFNELMTGSKSDIAVKIFGEDVAILKEKADEAAALMLDIPGAADIKVDQTEGLQQLSVQYDRALLARHGVNVSDVNQVIRAAYAGEKVGDIFEQERKFDLVVRIAPQYRQSLELENLTIHTANGEQVPLSELAQIRQVEGPMLVSREQARRFINIGVNVRDRDVAGLVGDIRTTLDESLELPPGYEIQYGGQFENLEHARDRLLVAVPVALALILLLLYLAFRSVVDTLIIFMAVPLSAVGGILALWIRDMPFSISSGVGFIALFGVSVLNGIVLLSAIRQLKEEEGSGDFKELITGACLSRMRPVLMTALVAALGFLPMAMSTGSGAEVQRPLATVVIGGLITSTLLTLILLPTLYFVIFKRSWINRSVAMVLVLIALGLPSVAQESMTFDQVYEHAVSKHPAAAQWQLAEEREVLNKSGLWSWSPVNLSYQGGQVNYNGYDHMISVGQDISPLLRAPYRTAKSRAVDRKVDLIQSEEALWQNNLHRDLMLAFNEWEYWYSKSLLQDSLSRMYADMLQLMELRHEKGAIDQLELDWFHAEIRSVEQELLTFTGMAASARSHLMELAFLAEDAVIQPTPLQRLELIDTAAQGLLADVMANKEAVMQADAEVIRRSANAFGTEVGYFAQSLEGDFLFQGFQVGLSIPLDRKKAKAGVQQKEIEMEILREEKAWKYHQLKLTANALTSRIQLLQQSLEAFEDERSERHLRIRDGLNRQMMEGRIDLLRFTQLQETLLTQEHDYLELLKEYNSHVIHLSHLSK